MLYYGTGDDKTVDQYSYDKPANIIYKKKHMLMDAQNNRLIDTVILRNHNICFGQEIRNYSKGWTLKLAIRYD